VLAGSWLKVLKSLTPCSSDMGLKQHAFGGMGTRIKSRGTKPLCATSRIVIKTLTKRKILNQG
jgi:hypothetical protein